MPAVITERPRILLGCWPVAVRNPGAVVIDHSERRVWGIRGIGRLPPAQFRFLTTALLNYGRVITYEELFEAMWGDRPDGGPEYAKSSITVRAYQVRALLRGSGLELGSHWGFGLQLGLEGEVHRYKVGKYYPKKQVRA